MPEKIQIINTTHSSFLCFHHITINMAHITMLSGGSEAQGIQYTRVFLSGEEEYYDVPISMKDMRSLLGQSLNVNRTVAA